MRHSSPDRHPDQPEHHQRGQPEQQRGLRACQLLLRRLPGPFIAEPARQRSSNALHLGNRVAAGIARLGRAADSYRRVIVEAHHLRRADDPADRGKGRQRHQVAFAVAHVEREDVVGLHAAGIVGLHDHALHAAAVGKVVDVGRAQIGRNGAVDVLEGHAERRGLLAVDDQFDLRRRRQSLDIDVLQDRALFRGGQELILRAHQRDISLLRPVL